MINVNVAPLAYGIIWSMCEQICLSSLEFYDNFFWISSEIGGSSWSLEDRCLLLLFLDSQKPFGDKSGQWSLWSSSSSWAGFWCRHNLIIGIILVCQNKSATFFVVIHHLGQERFLWANATGICSLHYCKRSVMVDVREGGNGTGWANIELYLVTGEKMQYFPHWTYESFVGTLSKTQQPSSFWADWVFISREGICPLCRLRAAR